MGKQKRAQNNQDRKAQKQLQKQELKKQQRTRTASDSSSSAVQAAAVLLGGVSSSTASKRLQYGLAVAALVLAVILCAISSSSLMRLDAAGRRAPASPGKQQGSGRGGGGGGGGVRASSWMQGGWRGLKGLGVGIRESLGFAGEEPVETRRRRQVLGGMRFNGLPPMQQAQKDAKTEKRERAALEAESEALAAMAQQPVMRVNGQEPDCLTAESCLGPSTAQRLARARSVGVGGMGGIEIGGGSGLL